MWPYLNDLEEPEPPPRLYLLCGLASPCSPSFPFLSVPSSHYSASHRVPFLSAVLDGCLARESSKYSAVRYYIQWKSGPLHPNCFRCLQGGARAGFTGRPKGFRCLQDPATIDFRPASPPCAWEVLFICLAWAGRLAPGPRSVSDQASAAKVLALILP